MRGSIEQLPCPDSPVRRFDPRWKLAAILLAVGAVLFLRTWPAAALALAGAVALALDGLAGGGALSLLAAFALAAVLLSPFAAAASVRLNLSG